MIFKGEWEDVMMLPVPFHLQGSHQAYIAVPDQATNCWGSRLRMRFRKMTVLLHVNETVETGEIRLRNDIQY
jgi:hypothetical protein